jgi:mono/diheme cytochrome c family protein
MIQKDSADTWRQCQWTASKRWLVVSVGVAMCAWLWALGLLCTSRTVLAQEEVKNPFEGDAQAIQEGFTLFQGLCVRCHGPGARGYSGPDLTDDYWLWGSKDADLFVTISAGRPGTLMSAFGERVTAIEIWKLIAYIRSQYQGKGRSEGSR